jgi:hypothetical protein
VDDRVFERHAVTREKSDVAITVAVLTPQESRASFGVPLESKGIQPVWLKVDNRNDYVVYIVPYSTDPNYYSAYEAAYVNHRVFRTQSNEVMDDFFQRSRIRLQVPPHRANSGFLFTNLNEGTKFVNIEIVHEQGAIREGFFFQLPNGAFDYEQSHLYSSPMPTQPLTSKSLRNAIETLPCCTTDAAGIKQGDPVNFVLIGGDDDILGALKRQGWDPTHSLGAATAWSVFHAYVSAKHYRYAPISSLYFYGRRQDIAMQKARSTINQRNHLRLWKSPYSYQGKPVWVGQISRDIGVRFASNPPFFVTHTIEPDVDDARSYLVQDLLASEYLHAVGWLKGVGRARPDHPRANLTGDPYFTDGMRAVMILSSKPASEDEIELLNWDSSTE